MAQHIDRYVAPETNGGWGFASFVILLAVLCAATAGYIYKKTYKHPTDVTWQSGIRRREEVAYSPVR